MSESVREIKQEGAYNYTYSAHHEPVAKVQVGETLCIHTVDALGNRMVRGMQSLPEDCKQPYANPQTGPIVVEGAEPGDTLVVKILAIQPTREYAVTGLVPFFGGLTSTTLDPTLQDALEEEWLYLPIQKGGIRFDHKRLIPYEPFMGTIGVAPEMEAVNSLTPGAHGGNMDCLETCPDNEVWFPVKAKGAHFFTGDAHAAQGDGELTGVALEMPAKVTLTFELKKGYAIEWPRIVSEEYIMAAGSARPMEAAARIAWVELIDWMVSDYGYKRLEAYHLLGQVGRLRVGNMVDPKFTMVAKCPREYLE